jgi:hypothetical protein
MSVSPAFEAGRGARDVEHLRLLSTFHFIGVGLAVLGIAMVAAQYATLQSMLSDPKVWGTRGRPMPGEVLTIFRWMFVVIAVWTLGTGVLNLLSALFIRARKHRKFSIVVAALNCIHVPLGTAMGVFTMVVLMRDSVRELYRAGER